MLELVLVSVTAQEGPILIGYGVNPQNVTPQFVRDHLDYMETRPFDGVALSNKSGWAIMDGNAITYDEMWNEFAPIATLKFKRLKHNFAMVYVNKPADLFDDWNITIQNFANLARVLKAAEIEGIFFDNEAYKKSLFNYPDDCKYATTKTLEDYEVQARLRGRQIMEAMVAINPRQYVMFFHGPYVSNSKTPKEVMPNNVAFANELLGPFFVGFLSGAGPAGKVCDGGELYHLRTPQEFKNAYEFRKREFASKREIAVSWIPEPLRAEIWAERCEVGFGIYNRGGQTTKSLRTALIHALRRTDRIVWFYVEGMDLFTPGGIPAMWEQAIFEARDETHQGD
jgi:hypothetical protein